MPTFPILPLDAHNAEDLPTVADVAAIDWAALPEYGSERNLYRAKAAAAALREYAALCGALDMERTETVLRDFLGDVRHLYDALGANAVVNDEVDDDWEDYDLDAHLDASYPRYLEERDAGVLANGVADE